jgi:hypothetical protein
MDTHVSLGHGLRLRGFDTEKTGGTVTPHHHVAATRRQFNSKPLRLLVRLTLQDPAPSLQAEATFTSCSFAYHVALPFDVPQAATKAFTYRYNSTRNGCQRLIPRLNRFQIAIAHQNRLTIKQRRRPKRGNSRQRAALNTTVHRQPIRRIIGLSSRSRVGVTTHVDQRSRARAEMIRRSKRKYWIMK